MLEIHVGSVYDYGHLLVAGSLDHLNVVEVPAVIARHTELGGADNDPRAVSNAVERDFHAHPLVPRANARHGKRRALFHRGAVDRSGAFVNLDPVLSVPVRITSTLTLLTVSLAAASSALSSTQDGKQQAQPIRSNKCKNVFFID